MKISGEEIHHDLQSKDKQCENLKANQPGK